MKIRLPVRAVQHKGFIVLKEVNAAGKELVQRIFRKKQDWEERNGREFYLQATLDLAYQKRTYKQNSAVWVLVQAIFESMEGRLPDEEEKYGLYLDLLEQYADKVPSRFGGLRPVHISEANSLEGARFIDGLLYHLSKWCDLSMDAQAGVVDVLQQWEEWRGELETDPIDYSDSGCSRLITEAEWRERHQVSEASGRGGKIVLAHIVSRGADSADIEKAWNWLALTDDEHLAQHQHGWEEFLRIYPHLRGRVERARRMAKKAELKAAPQSATSLALEAIEI
jgi:hypothetical protein